MADEKKFEKALEIPNHEMEIASDLSEVDLEKIAGGAVCETCSSSHRP